MSASLPVARHTISEPPPSEPTPLMPDASVEREPDLEIRNRSISEAAFDRYMRRGCTDGYDLDDWLQAEAEVDARTRDIPAAA